jgi:IMP dehydrogenase
MKAKSFQDTDTLYLILRESESVETRDLDEDTLADYDQEGRLVSMTLEHASSRADNLGIEDMDAYVIVIDERVTLGMAETARNEGLEGIEDIEEVDYAHHPLVQKTQRLQDGDD